VVTTRCFWHRSNLLLIKQMSKVQNKKLSAKSKPKRKPKPKPEIKPTTTVTVTRAEEERKKKAVVASTSYATSKLSRLGSDIMQQIFLFLEPRNWFGSARVCSTWHQMLFEREGIETNLWEKAPFLLQYNRAYKTFVGSLYIIEVKLPQAPVEDDVGAADIEQNAAVHSDTKSKITKYKVQEHSYANGEPQPPAFLVRHLHAHFKSQGYTDFLSLHEFPSSPFVFFFDSIRFIYLYIQAYRYIATSVASCAAKRA
jgi:hypothetical protein